MLTTFFCRGSIGTEIQGAMAASAESERVLDHRPSPMKRFT